MKNANPTPWLRPHHRDALQLAAFWLAVALGGTGVYLTIKTLYHACIALRTAF